MNITYQKYGIITTLFAINILLSGLFIKYSKHWYAFTFILALSSFINSISVLLIIYKRFTANEKQIIRIYPKNYLYVVPCYNESEEELRQSLNSLTLQRIVKDDKRCLLIVCDGIVQGQGNDQTTDSILKKILNVADFGDTFEYTTWDNTQNVVTIYKGKYTHLVETIDFILCVKVKNYGKRDSLVLIRKLCYKYNNFLSSHKSENEDNKLYTYMFDNLLKIYNNTIDYIIGIDADTIFEYNCTYELIKEIEKDKSIVGSVGFVDINKTHNRFSPWVLYQYAEYTYAQCLKRYTQSNMTQKVNCLSGCNQILRICEETCGDKILSQFNRLPAQNENIFNHIRSYASEDRNHVCLMLSMYPYVNTSQTLSAIAYTNIPRSIKVFLSQRRRWNLGANSNDLMLSYLPGINIFERISAFVNVMTFSLTIFIFIATIYFIIAIATSPSILMLYLSVIMIIPFSYAISIPIFVKKQPYLYYYLSLLTFYSLSGIVNLITHLYSILQMDTIKWGKTRKIQETNNKDVLIDYVENITNDRIESHDGSHDGSDEIIYDKFNNTSPSKNPPEYLVFWSDSDSSSKSSTQPDQESNKNQRETDV
jgi:chitin synthase